jgi:GNAT superfamily N-acetyltransferase
MININQVKVRKMMAQDIELIAQAFTHMNKTREQYERYWQENVTGQRVTLIAELEGCIVGYTNIIWQSGYESFRRQDIPEINDMNVVAPLRRNGIGTKMVEAAEHIVQQHGKTIIGIGVGGTPDYEIAQRLYPKLGYVYDGTGIHQDEWGGAMYLTKKLG